MPKLLDSQDPEVKNFVFAVLGDAADLSNKERAVRLYYAVRDGFRYDPYDIRLEEEELNPTLLLKKKKGHCIDKAAFLATILRMIGIPAKLGLARVRNHIGTARLEKNLGTDVLVPHGYTDVLINERWLKCTPAFNMELCDKLGVHPLEWDGESDSMFQEDSRAGGRFMEYLEDYGSFDDLPLDFIKELMQSEYPQQFDAYGRWIPIQ